jgi:hypothetical protein
VSRLARRSLAGVGGAQDRDKTTRGSDGAAPEGQGSRGDFLGEATGKEAVGRLAGRTPKRCPPGV